MLQSCKSTLNASLDFLPNKHHLHGIRINKMVFGGEAVGDGSRAKSVHKNLTWKLS